MYSSGHITRAKYSYDLQGAITIVFGLIACWFLPHTPGHASFLTEQQREAAIARMRLDAHGASAANDVEHESFSWHWVKMAMVNWNTILLSLNFFAIITPIYSYSLFLPTIIKSLGYTAVHAQLLTVPPNACAFVTVLLTGYFSDRAGARGPFMLAGITLAIIGYILLISSGQPHINYAGTFFVAAGIFPCSPLVMGWLANNLAPHYVRATGTGAQIMIANVAAFIATFTYISTDGPRYITGHAINLGMLGMALIITTIMIVYVKVENKKRDDGKRDNRLQGDVDEAMLGYKHPSFRYTM